MMKKIFIAFLILLCSATGAIARSTDDSAASPSEFNAGIDPVLQGAINTYLPWESVSFSGRVRTAKLPISITVRMYMEKDSLIQISLRAPLLGEVGCVFISGTHVTAVNKMKKVYCEEDVAGLIDMYPGAISDIQSLFLGRIVLLGEGELNVENSRRFTVMTDDDVTMILPAESRDGILDFDYGYTVTPAGRTQSIVANIPQRGISLSMIYSYLNRGEQIAVTLNNGGKKTDVDIDFDSVKWGGTPMSPVNTSSYRRVGFSEFLSSF